MTYTARSKYDPLRLALEARHDREAPMSFAQIEEILGFSLPASARRLPAWWANTRGTHVQAASWLDAGWRTSRVELTRERLVFVRNAFRADLPAAPGFAEGAPAVVVIRREALTPGALRLLEDYSEELGAGLGDAAAAALNAAAADRRRRLVQEFAALSPEVGGDSAAMVREDRDGR